MSASVSNRNNQEVTLNEPLLTSEDAARLLVVRESWVREATRAGRLPHIRVGRHIRYHHSDLEAWVNRQREPSRAP